MSWRVLVVDDEAPARRNLESLLAEQPDWTLVASCASAADARLVLVASAIDLVFLDIRMPFEDGLVFAETLSARPQPPLIVFVTAYDEHALAAFSVYAIDYVLKPFDDARFARVLERAAAQLRARSLLDNEDLKRFLAERRALASGGSVPPLLHLVVRSVGQVERIAVSTLRWLVSAGNYVELHTSGRRVLHRATLSELERRLPAAEFLRVHRTVIVRRALIEDLRVTGDGQYQLILREDGARVPVSERHVAAVRTELLR